MKRPASLYSLWIIGAVASFVALALGCGHVDDSDHSSASLDVRAAFNGDYGFALEPSSAERLAATLRPGEKLNVVIGGERREIHEVAWKEVSLTSRGPFLLEARAGEAVRQVGGLQLTDPSAPACDSSSGVDALPLGVGVENPSPTMAVTASCTHNNRYWNCLGCQCKTGINLRGWAQRFICIYGTLYPEQVYSCICPFTPRTCGIKGA